MIAFIGEKWRDAGGRTWSIVICEFRKWKELRPIVLLIIAIDTEVLFKGLIKSFGLPIAFWVITGGKMEFHVQCLTERMEEMRHEFGTPVRGDMRRYTMF